MAELDLVLAVPTSAAHLAGALGTPAYVAVPDRPHFHYSTSESRSPYYDCVRFYPRSDEAALQRMEADIAAG